MAHRSGERRPLLEREGADAGEIVNGWINNNLATLPSLLIGIHVVLLRGLAALFDVNNDFTACTQAQRVGYCLEAAFVLLVSFVLIARANLELRDGGWGLTESAARTTNWFAGVDTEDEESPRDVPFWTACCTGKTCCHRSCVVVGARSLRSHEN